MNVLIVDDDASICDFLAFIVAEAGFNPIKVTCPVQALDVLISTKIDMIFVDVVMPDMNGFELTLKFRKVLKDNWIPIIFLSSSDSDDDYKKAVAAGGDDYLTKPIRPIVVETKLKTMSRISKIKDEVDFTNRKLLKLTYEDDLTKVPNRRFFQRQLLKEWRRDKSSTDFLSLMMIDIDFFKNYNDFYGHLKGDLCLKKIAKAIQRSLSRPLDSMSRYGGEEFSILLPSTKAIEAEVIATRIIENISELNVQHQKSEVSDHVTVSIGISSTEFSAATSSILLSEADKALYVSKDGGRNKFSTYS